MKTINSKIDPAKKPSTSVRIIGGSLRNSKISVIDQEGLRPTPDRVRETLFNWLAPMIEGACVLDLFAGTGALGIEALSRGAARADFVELDATLARKIAAELQRLKVAELAQVHVASALAVLSQQKSSFDVIFLDPPFALYAWSECLALIANSALLKAHGVVYIEAPLDWQTPPGWQGYKQARAAAVQFGLYRYVAKTL
jgi:16S rRNA (guanine966-N2)-methyltransferase